MAKTLVTTARCGVGVAQAGKHNAGAIFLGICRSTQRQSAGGWVKNPPRVKGVEHVQEGEGVTRVAYVASRKKKWKNRRGTNVAPATGSPTSPVTHRVTPRTCPENQGAVGREVGLGGGRGVQMSVQYLDVPATQFVPGPGGCRRLVLTQVPGQMRRGRSWSGPCERCRGLVSDG